MCACTVQYKYYIICCRVVIYGQVLLHKIPFSAGAAYVCIITMVLAFNCEQQYILWNVYAIIIGQGDHNVSDVKCCTFHPVYDLRT